MNMALDLKAHLPSSFKELKEQNYVDFLWFAFEENYIARRYEFASFAFHLLYMSFASFTVWQIRLARPKQFAHAMVGFRNENEMNLISCKSPFQFYNSLRESEIFRFLKLIGCTNKHVGEFTKFVQRRNKMAHPTGSLFFKDQNELNATIEEMMHEVDNIKNHMQPVILEIYRQFLVNFEQEKLGQYQQPKYRIQKKLIHPYYMSDEDLLCCREFNMNTLAGKPSLADAEAFHASLRGLYPPRSSKQ